MDKSTLILILLSILWTVQFAFGLYRSFTAYRNIIVTAVTLDLMVALCVGIFFIYAWKGMTQ